MPRDTSAGSRRTEFLGLLCFALALMLFVSLGTYSPDDPVMFFKAGSGDGPVHNFIGPTGAFLAELLVPQLFGLAAILIPLALGGHPRKPENLWPHGTASGVRRRRTASKSSSRPWCARASCRFTLRRKRFVGTGWRRSSGTWV